MSRRKCRRGGASAKPKAQQAHAIRRAWERFGLTVTQEAYDDACMDIYEGRATFLEKESNRVYHFLVNLAGREVPVVYDRMRKTIVTVLPEGSYDVRESIAV